MEDTDRKVLSQKAFHDPSFRARLLKDPTAAAKELGIDLPAQDHQAIVANADRIRQHGAQIDQAAQSGNKLHHLMPTIIPGIFDI
jgi:hypothetical protein